MTRQRRLAIGRLFYASGSPKTSPCPLVPHPALANLRLKLAPIASTKMPLHYLGPLLFLTAVSPPLAPPQLRNAALLQAAGPAGGMWLWCGCVSPRKRGCPSSVPPSPKTNKHISHNGQGREGRGWGRAGPRCGRLGPLFAAITEGHRATEFWGGGVVWGFVRALGLISAQVPLPHSTGLHKMAAA